MSALADSQSVFTDRQSAYTIRISLACKTNGGGGIVDCCILHGEAWAGNYPINAWDSGTLERGG